MLNQLYIGILILITVALNTIAQVFLKVGTKGNILNLYLLGGISAYGLSTILYLLVLSKANLSIAYPVVIGLTVTATTISSTILLKEGVSTMHWMGIGLILSGICTVTFSKLH
ncbi:SMR family transporter [Acaryochloris sp. IP29b_bin.148]|uniref:DMT family transporter n=1 Tax=Acaryochloris sp. IP29b_bin.148 TaxID=2969218 RepID=UPI00261F1DCE|nr:SMR family transporter [Acaryochloris sp. IP29b_bin.148]